MNYWHMQIHPSGQAAEFAPHLAGILARGIIGLGEWPQGAAAIRAFKETMQAGDIVAVKRGGQLVALVEVAGDAYTAAPYACLIGQTAARASRTTAARWCAAPICKPPRAKSSATGIFVP